MARNALSEPGTTQTPHMLSRGQWGLYFAGMSTEALFVLGLSLGGFILATIAMAIYR